MNILFHDTETTGYARMNDSVHSVKQPFCLQIGAIVYNTECDKVLQKISTIMQWPLTEEVPEEANAVHGIHAGMVKNGLPPEFVMPIIYQMAKTSDYCVGFNAAFDRKVIASAFSRTGAVDVAEYFEKNVPHYDIMKPLTNVCKLPNTRGGYKWPKLQEAHEFCFGHKFEGAHDAFADIQATFDIWRWCRQYGIDPVMV